MRWSVAFKSRRWLWKGGSEAIWLTAISWHGWSPLLTLRESLVANWGLWWRKILGRGLTRPKRSSNVICTRHVTLKRGFTYWWWLYRLRSEICRSPSKVKSIGTSGVRNWVLPSSRRRLERWFIHPGVILWKIINSVVFKCI